MKFLICLVTFLVAINCGDNVKILGVFPMASHSHFTLGFRLMKELADRGHQVTVINPYPQKTPIKNYKDVSLEDLVSNVDTMKEELYDMGKMSFLGQIRWVTNMGYYFTERVLAHKNVQNLIKSSEQFDLVIIENFVNDAHMVFGHIFKCPLVLLAPGPPTIFNNYLFANPSPPSYIPNLLANFGSHMNLWERIKNVYYDIAGELYRELVVLPRHAEILRKTIPEAPELSQIIYNNVSLLLLTSHVSIQDAVPLVPAIKEIGGYHLQPTKPLPKDIKEFLDDAKEGVVIFSMGSNLKSADLPADKKQAILNAFAKLKQKVLWKFEKDLPEKSDNVKIMKWFPQQDILAHPNVKAFITHGGLLSTIETVYFAVPMIGIPVFWDQELNIERAVIKGYAVRIPLKDLDEAKLSKALEEVLDNPKYANNVKLRSEIMHDQPMKPIDSAVYWIEYVIRHKGAPHLKTAGVELIWYQRHLLDVIVLLTLITVILFVIFYIIIRKLLGLRKCCNKRCIPAGKKNK